MLELWSAVVTLSAAAMVWRPPASGERTCCLSCIWRAVGGLCPSY